MLRRQLRGGGSEMLISDNFYMIIASCINVLTEGKEFASAKFADIICERPKHL